MNYNLHPIFVHFPIALLLLYSFFVIFPLKKIIIPKALEISQRILLFFGMLGILVSRTTGDSAAHLTNPSRNILQLHEFFAGATTVVYSILLFITLLPLINTFVKRYNWVNKIYLSHLVKIHLFLYQRWLLVTLSIIGAIALFMTGLFGGALVYGTTADPLVPFIFKIFGIK